MVKVFEGSFGKCEPVASCTRASFRGFLRREAMFIMLPRMKYLELYGNWLSRLPEDRKTFNAQNSRDGDVIADCFRSTPDTTSTPYALIVLCRHLLRVQRIESSACVVCLQSILIVVCGNTSIAVARVYINLSWNIIPSHFSII